MTVGKRIRNIRLNLGMTMEEFARWLDTSKGAVNNWEKDCNKPNPKRLKMISDLAGIKVVELLEGESE